MSLKSHFTMMAEYNRWMNERLYETAQQLGEDKITADQGAFFGSIAGTLNHIMVGDLIWLNRFALHPGEFQSLNAIKQFANPAALTDQLYPEFSELMLARQELDRRILGFTSEVAEHDYTQPLTYQDFAGNSICKPFAALMQHFFNHQTHHRGQVTTLISQLGVDPGVTDLNAIIPQL